MKSNPPGPETEIRNYPKLLNRYQRLLELTSDLAATFDLDTLLQRIVVAARELTDSEASSLLLYEKQTHSLYFEAATGALVDGVGQRAIPADNSIAGWVFTHGEPILSQDVLNDPRFYREMDALTQFETQSILGVPLRTKDKVLGVIESVNKTEGIFTDEDVQILQTLAAQAAIAIENSQLFMQSDLIAEIVHELRTPLAALTAASHLLQRSDLPADQRTKLSQTILNEVQRLNDLTTDFLELSRLESGRTHFEREPVHLGGLVQESLEVVRAQAESKEIKLETEIDPSLTPVHGDRKILKQLLLNLLTNAIKYSPPESVVTVVLRSEGNEVLMEVRDTGRGISPEDQKRLFQRFYRAGNAQDEVQGTGLGLVIAKRIAESHEGSISVESTLGKGSTFTVRLPERPSTGATTRPRN
ncbi:MAG: GAF domain-containing protein [Chloroflexi bacterium]|nr:GAF domain-containing protein [Chloroflexota bacterium]